MRHTRIYQFCQRRWQNCRGLFRLPAPQSELSRDIIKDPYIFELVGLKEKIVEKDIETAMLEQIKTVLLELGKGFSFIGNQYRISTPSNDYLIDLLFYHLELRCYVVVELKNVDFKPDFIGQLQFYITAVDETLKKDVDNPTIGLLLCKGKDRYSVEWSLKAMTAPIGVASYEIRNYLLFAFLFFIFFVFSLLPAVNRY